MKKPFRVCSAAGILGYGYPEESLNLGMEMHPDVIGCDAGSVDPGPYYLGSGTAFVARSAAKRDMELLVKAALKEGIPLVIGSAGGAGGDLNVKFMTDIVDEIAEENDLHFKMGVVYSEQDKDYLKKKLKEGKIRPLDDWPELTEQDIDDAVHAVRLMGHHGVEKMIKEGCDVVVGGRMSDTALFAAVPLMNGCNPDMVWHAAKILECGAASCDPVRSNDTIIVDIGEDWFTAEPMNPAIRHTTVSVAAHSLYENSSPFCFYEPSGMIDLRASEYEQVTDRKVRVTGSRMIKADVYTEKIEAAVLRGYRTISIMGIRDPILIHCLDEYENTVRNELAHKVAQTYEGMTEKDYTFNFHVYGRDAVMREMEPVKEVDGHEVCVLLEVIAESQEISSTILAMARTSTLHNGFTGRKCTAGNTAVAFSPSDIPMGEVYEFSMNHVLELEDPLEAIRFETRVY